LDENVQSNLGVFSWDTFRLHEDDHSMQRAPQHFGQKFRLLPIWPKCDDQLGEGSTEADIMAAVATRGFEELATRLRMETANVTGAPDVLRNVCAAYLDFARSRPVIYEAMFVLPTKIKFASEETPTAALSVGPCRRITWLRYPQFSIAVDRLYRMAGCEGRARHRVRPFCLPAHG
jgi:hypothetical protein